MTIAKPWMFQHTRMMVFITRLPPTNQDGYQHGGHRGPAEQAEKKQACTADLFFRSAGFHGHWGTNL
jgi:hypothetical protein